MVDSDLRPLAPLWVHSEPCGPILKSYLSFPIKLRIGIISAVATLTMAAIALCLTLGLEEYWKKPPVETTVDDFNRPQDGAISFNNPKAARSFISEKLSKLKMGKINGCIKCLFIFFNVLFAIFGCVLVYLAVQVTVFSHQVTSVGGPSLVWSWVFVLGVFVLPVLGILDNSLDTASAEAAKSFMEDEEMRMMLMAIEESAHCCGVVSSSDWGNKLSQSCECKMQNTGFSFSSGCKAKPVGALGPDQIYKTSCSGLFGYFDLFFKVIMGICFTFAILALLALLMSILMIHQIRKHDSGGSVSTQFHLSEKLSKLKMGKINGCIKCLFIFFNVVFALLGGFLVYLAVKAAPFSHQVTSVGGPSLVWSWVFVLGVFVLPFAGFMVAGMIIMLIFGIVVVVSRNMDSFDTASDEAAKPFMENEKMNVMLMGFEEAAHCCGVVSSSDWGNNLSQSCECKMENTGFPFSSGCKAKPVGALGPDQIYKTSCSHALFGYFDLFFKVIMGICFTFAILALLALLMSILMIHQIRKHDSGGSSMAMKSY
ncbi:hypothetical protein F7725_022089 [Dissostichus mawsoni]|uniref:Tetraspanin n=1 Tax=Dissostichus mawsoni TaxID=36200 RepID=A0A7J5ZDN2_DISMA|nr:hypothetical protein F7725_022089 [Dissostichus mawsoni]